MEQYVNVTADAAEVMKTYSLRSLLRDLDCAELWLLQAHHGGIADQLIIFMNNPAIYKYKSHKAQRYWDPTHAMRMTFA